MKAGEISSRLSVVRERIAAVGGDPERVTVVAVTKTFPLEVAASAIEAGLPDLGENRAQELVAKAEGSEGWRQGPRWHFIGGLQRNKVKTLAGRVHLWHTIDRAVLIDELQKRAPGARILIQVNVTDEPQKSGCRPEETAELVERARQAGVVPLGLMTMGPTDGGDPRPGFELLRRLSEANGLAELSMGMSGDYEVAVGEGATIIRVGSVLFGARRTGG